MTSSSHSTFLGQTTGAVTSALALSAGLTAPATVQAELVIVDLATTVPNGGSLDLDINDDGLSDIRIKAQASGGTVSTIFKKAKGKISFKTLMGKSASGNKPLLRLSAGDSVSDESVSLWSSFGYAYSSTNQGAWGEIGATGFLPLRLQRSDSGDGGNATFFGWLEMTRGSLTLGRLGFQNTAGAAAPIPGTPGNGVPEPGTLALLALGAAGLAATRRRQRADPTLHTA